jgi:Tol biopolymer transport system component
MEDKGSSLAGVAEKLSPDRLESWKEIAAYLKRDIRTVQRWEKKEGLPVHRHAHDKRASAYAYRLELDSWRERRQPVKKIEPSPNPTIEQHPPAGAENERPWPGWAVAAAVALLLAVGAGILNLRSGWHRPASPSERGSVVIRQLWAGTDVDGHGGASTDGRYLSYIDRESGDLAIRNLRTGEKRRLTDARSRARSTQAARFPLMAKGIEWVAYAWCVQEASCELQAVDLNGSHPRLLYRSDDIKDVQPAAWFPDGRQLLAILTRRDGASQIARLSIADGSLRVLKALDKRRPLTLSLSPDERYITYDLPPDTESRQRDIFVLAADGSREVALVQHPANDLFPLWTPDGGGVVFVSDRTGSPGVWLSPIRDGQPAGPPRLVKADMGRMLPLGLGADGSYYYSLQTDLRDLFIAHLDPATSKLTEAPLPVAQRFMSSEAVPEWSPDGQSIAYVRHRGPYEEQSSGTVCIRSLRENKEREYSAGLNHLAEARWSPDGRWILLSGSNNPGGAAFYRLSLETGEVTPVLEAPPGVHARHPVWSADARAIIYARSGGSSADVRAGSPVRAWEDALVWRNLETGNEIELYRCEPSCSLGHVALSRDSRWLAFLVHEPASRTDLIRVMPLEGGKPHDPIRVEAPLALADLAWTPDGRILFAAANLDHDAATTEMWRVSPQGGLAEFVGGTTPGLNGFRLHPDGRQVAFSAGHTTSEVWVMENPRLLAGAQIFGL